MLGKIFSRQITNWNDAELRAGGVNAGLESVDANIVVFHRDKGSSTTNFFTKVRPPLQLSPLSRRRCTDEPVTGLLACCCCCCCS